MHTPPVRNLAAKVTASALLSLCLLSANAMANDAVVGALLGGGAGALVGRSIGGRDGTIIGGAIGAAAGAAIGSEHGRGSYDGRRAVYAEPRVQYLPPPPVYYSQPVRVMPAPVYYRQPVRVIEAPVYYVRDKHHRRPHGRDWQRRDRDDDRFSRYGR